MKIGIDGYEANVGSRVGIGRYAYEITAHLYPISKNHDVTVFLPTAPRPDMPKERDNWHYVVSSPQVLWTFFGLPRAIKSHPVDVFFSPTHYIPRFTGAARVMAIMDLSYLKFPEMFRAKDLYQLRNWTAYSARHAAAIFTISEASKNDIIKAYGVPGSRVTVTYPGFHMADAKVAIAEKNYILSVGTLQPRKNYIRLIEAFALFLGENKQKFGDLKLVIIGKKGWLYEDILAAPKKYGIAEKVKFLDFVPDSELPAYYKKALCFVLPSLYEGFGLPVLEAMAYGCPIVVSDVSSLPEIAGKAAVYVNPDNVESIKNGLLSAVRQRNLMQGRNRVKAGEVQVKKFSWEKAAKESLAILEKVGGAK